MIGHLAYKYAEEGHNVVVFSNDGDFFQLMINDNIKVYNPNRGFIRPEDHDDYGVPPELIIAFKALVGDSSDEYHGVPRFGKMTAKKFFKRNKGVDGIFDGKASFKDITNSMAARLMECKEDIYMCKKLATIDPVKGKVDAIVWNDKDLHQFKGHCEELEFNSFLEKRWKEFEALPEGGI